MQGKKISLWIGILVPCIIAIVIFTFPFPNWLHADYSSTGLHPEVQQATQKLIDKSRQKGIEVKITDGFRPIEEQEQLYEKGRSQPGKIVTNADGGESYHNYGLAIDIVLFDPKRKKLSWDSEADRNGNGRSDWLEVVKVAKKLGFAWGGDWKSFQDKPHFEMTFGQSVWALQVKTSLHKWFG